MRFLCALLTLLCYSLSFAHELPPHARYQILTTDPTSSTVTQKSFNSIPHIIYSQHYLDLKKNQLEVTINTDWETPYFSAWVKDEAPKKFSINFWGGIVRIPGMNDNGLALIACHEMGHLLGGEPRSKLPAFLWATSEGQSDYYASSICLKRYFERQFDLGRLDEPQVQKSLYTRCRTKYPETKNFLICLNIMNGIEAFTKILTHLDSQKREINFSKKSPAAKFTNVNSYPEPQCRTEILIAGNFCSPENYPCLTLDSARPQCWFVD